MFSLSSVCSWGGESPCDYYPWYCFSCAPIRTSNMFKLVYYEARMVGKRAIGIVLECFITVRNEVWRLCFHRRVSVHRGGVPGPGGCLLLGGAWSWGVSAPGVPWGVGYPSMHWGRPPRREIRLLLRTVRILLKCILVLWMKLLYLSNGKSRIGICCFLQKDQKLMEEFIEEKAWPRTLTMKTLNRSLGVIYQGRKGVHRSHWTQSQRNSVQNGGHHQGVFQLYPTINIEDDVMSTVAPEDFDCTYVGYKHDN